MPSPPFSPQSPLQLAAAQLGYANASLGSVLKARRFEYAHMLDSSELERTSFAYAGQMLAAAIRTLGEALSNNLKNEAAA